VPDHAVPRRRDRRDTAPTTVVARGPPRRALRHGGSRRGRRARAARRMGLTTARRDDCRRRHDAPIPRSQRARRRDELAYAGRERCAGRLARQRHLDVREVGALGAPRWVRGLRPRVPPCG
jgi:hypothetical protein